MTDLDKASRAVCASSLNGFCQNVGGSLGCKNGRGERGAHLCVANSLQLDMAGHTDTARAVMDALDEVDQPETENIWKIAFPELGARESALLEYVRKSEASIKEQMRKAGR